jgi:hypothetical protein
MDNENSKPSATKAPVKSASQRFPGILLRLILVLTAGCLVGAVVYFSAVGWIPYIEQRIFQPIDDNQAEINSLSTAQADLEDQIINLQDTLNAALSTASDPLAEAVEAISAELEAIQIAIDTNTYYAATLNPEMIATVTSKLDATNRNLSAIATAQMKGVGIPQDINMLRVLTLLSQANMHLLHDNYGLAGEQLELARQFLADMVVKVPPAQRVVVLEMIKLIESSLKDLPSRPGLAADKLELAWKMGIAEFPQQESENLGTITPTPTADPELTTTPTPN